MKKTTYIVTAKAGEWVAGRIVPESRRIDLTDEEAAHELRLGTIERAKPTVQQVAPPAKADEPKPAVIQDSGKNRK